MGLASVKIYDREIWDGEFTNIVRIVRGLGD